MLDQAGSSGSGRLGLCEGLLEFCVLLISLAGQADVAGNCCQIIVEVVGKSSRKQAEAFETLLANGFGGLEFRRSDVGEKGKDATGGLVVSDFEPAATG